MTVTNIQVSIDRVQADGSRKIWYLVTDTIEGDVQVYRGQVNSDFNPSLDFPLYTSAWEANKEAQEIGRAIKRVQRGENALVVSDNPERTTKKKIAKKLIYYAMKEKDPYFLLSLEPLIENLKLNYTNTELANFLDITTDQLIKLNNKYNSIISAKTQLNDADQIQEEWQ